MNTELNKIKRWSAYLLASLAVMVLTACGGGDGVWEAPSGLTYSNPDVVYTVGEQIVPNEPSNSGGKILAYSIEPALPSGLTIDPETGIISGTPASESAATIYTVTGTRGQHQLTARLDITVRAAETKPGSLAYRENPVVYTVNQAIVPNEPITTGGEISQYVVVPALPAGLALDGKTGIISGTPTIATPATDYTITGSNTAGSVTAVVNMEVRSGVTPPANLAYSYPTAQYVKDLVIVPNQPRNDGGTITRYAVNPALPEGLSLNENTGEITGTPSQLQAAAAYTITGSNSAGSASATVELAVIEQPVAPTFMDLSSTGWLNCDSLDGADYAIRVNVPDLTQFLRDGETVTLTWTPYRSRSSDEVIADAIKTEVITLGGSTPATGFVWRVAPYATHVQPTYEPGDPDGRARIQYTFQSNGLTYTSAVTETVVSMWSPLGPCAVTP